MKTSRFSEEQIIKAIKEAKVGRKVPDICCALGVSEATFHTWRRKYVGLDVLPRNWQGPRSGFRRQGPRGQVPARGVTSAVLPLG